MILKTAPLCALLSLAACESGGNGKPGVATEDSVHHDLPRLGRILGWDSLAPRSATYRISVLGTPSDRVPGPTDWSLEAVLRYDSLTFRKLLGALRAKPSTDSVKMPLALPPWLDSLDRRAFDAGTPFPPQENSVFSRQGCPNGILRPIPPGTLLVDCQTR